MYQLICGETPEKIATKLNHHKSSPEVNINEVELQILEYNGYEY